MMPSARTFFLALALTLTATASSAKERRQSNASSLTSEKAADVYTAICASSDSAVGQATVSADINNVTVNVLSIQNQFDDIRATLAAIDEEHLDPRQLAPTWGVLAQNWTNLLWGSRQLASNIIVYCNELTDVVLPLVANQSGITVDPPAAVSTLVDYLVESGPLDASSEALAVGFQTLSADVTDFYKTYINFAEGQSVTDNQMIVQLQMDIASLRDDVTKAQIEIAVLGAAMGITFFLDVGAILLMPEFTQVLVAAGAAILGAEAAPFEQAKARITNDQDDITEDNIQIAELKAQLGLIAAAQTNLQLVNTTAASVGSQLNAFPIIWNAVNADINKAADYIQMSINQTNNTVIPLLWWATLNQVPQCIYGALTEGLNNYTIGITDSGLPPPTGTASTMPELAIDVAEHHSRTMEIIAGHVPGFVAE
ncbi:hypothetical protein C8F04DRAFT_1095430 [Mycena alexandri]|uniref:Uncharacterized protein n=1 Tax=Mycena alexandri TaxID=1745969 RepID=A0AAD6SZL1_9AGAR|nr:hypothetical protein C8F04DRAFT_1095430 [Mycena alexandri]